MELKPLGKNIIFTFLDDTAQGKFIPKSQGGIILTNIGLDHNRDSKWGRVAIVGPDVDPNEIKVGDYILIEPLKWTPGFEFNETKYWKTDSDKVMIVTSEEPHYSI